jgi:hypothetical protein
MCFQKNRFDGHTAHVIVRPRGGAKNDDQRPSDRTGSCLIVALSFHSPGIQPFQFVCFAIMLTLIKGVAVVNIRSAAEEDMLSTCVNYINA